MTDELDLLKWQGGLCGACACRLAEETMHLDHEHRSGLVRGWLCGRCNVGEGIDLTVRPPDPETGEPWNWDTYRRNPPARRMGITLPGERRPAVSWAEHDAMWALDLIRRRVHSVEEIAESTGMALERVQAMAEAGARSRG